MTAVMLHPVLSHPVTVGDVTLYLSGWKCTGAAVIREQCTADGTAGVTAGYPKGTRLSMEGKLPPAADAAAVTAALAKRLHDGTMETITVGGLCFADARLCGYTVQAGRGAADVTLLFYAADAPEREAAGDAE